MTAALHTLARRLCERLLAPEPAKISWSAVQAEARELLTMIEREAAVMMPIMGGSSWEKSQVSMTLLRPHEKQALVNHGQSLDTLRSRGGLSPSEAVAILEDRRWRRMPEDKALRLLRGAIDTPAPREPRQWPPTSAT